MGNEKIDIIDLLRRILRQWKFIVIAALVCGLIFEGIGYARAYMKYRQQTQEAEEEEEEEASDQYLSELESQEEDLTEWEISEAQIAAAAYASYKDQYQEELLYCQNAIKMQLDTNRVPTYTLQYTVPDLNTDSEAADQIASAVFELIVNEETCEEIKTALGWDTELGYIAELIEVQAQGSGITASEADSGLDSFSTVNQVMIQIQAPSQDDCAAIAGIIKSRVEQESQQLSDIYGEFEITLLNESYIEKTDNTLRSYQDSRYSALNSLRSAIGSLSSNMTDDQMDYYYTLILYNMAEDSEEEEFISEAEEAEEEAAVSAPGIIRWRYILLGLFLGVVLACGIIFLQYILAKNLRVKEDMEDTYNVPMLGYLPVNDKRQRFTKEERMEMICAGIRVAIQKGQLKSVYLTGTAGDGESQQVMEQIEAALADCGAQIQSGRDVACDPASLEQMTASDGVVFVERVNRSPYADIQKEVELCQTYQIPVIGSVVIE